MDFQEWDKMQRLCCLDCGIDFKELSQQTKAPKIVLCDYCGALFRWTQARELKEFNTRALRRLMHSPKGQILTAKQRTIRLRDKDRVAILDKDQALPLDEFVETDRELTNKIHKLSPEKQAQALQALVGTLGMFAATYPVQFEVLLRLWNEVDRESKDYFAM